MDNQTLLLIIGAAILALIVAVLLVRSSRRRARAQQRILSERSGTERPYLREAPPPTPLPTAHERHDRVTDEVASAATDVVSQMLGIDGDEAAAAHGDDLQRLKGVGPKLASRLHELGITRYHQLATMDPAEAAAIDDRLGAFKGRLARDRVIEQARLLDAGDIAGFEAQFGKLGDA